MNGEKALRRLPFCGAARNLSLFTFASVSTIPRGACALPSAMAAVNTKPLNSAAAADKSEAAAGVFAAGSGTLPVRRGETFAAVSGAFLLHLKPPRSERNPCCFLPILPSFLPPRGLRPAKPVAAPTSEAPYKNAKRDAADRMAASSLCFSGTARAPAAKLLLIVLSVIPPKTVKVSAESFLFPIFFFQTNGRTCPTTVAVPP